MPKKQNTPRQPYLLPKRAIPQMPEGYYSYGPNPNLRRFVEELTIGSDLSNSILRQ